MTGASGTNAPRLRRDLNIVTGLGLPRWSTGPQGDFAAVIAAAKAAGYEGVQHFVPQQVLAAGLAATGMGRVLQPSEAHDTAKRLKESGCEVATLHVGTGLETDAEMDALAGAVLEASARNDIPLYVETHRATITQDLRRTVDLVARFSELRFNADLSHWYCGHEMPYGDFEAKLAFLQPVFDRVRFMHARMADPSCAQVTIEENETRLFLSHFREMWRRCFAAYKRSSETARPLYFAVELLPYRIDTGGQTHWTCYARQRREPDGTWTEESDRWQQANLLWKIGEEEFAGA